MIIQRRWPCKGTVCGNTLPADDIAIETLTLTECKEPTWKWIGKHELRSIWLRVSCRDWKVVEMFIFRSLDMSFLCENWLHEVASLHEISMVLYQLEPRLLYFELGVEEHFKPGCNGSIAIHLKEQQEQFCMTEIIGSSDVIEIIAKGSESALSPMSQSWK